MTTDFYMPCFSREKEVTWKWQVFVCDKRMQRVEKEDCWLFLVAFEEAWRNVLFIGWFLGGYHHVGVKMSVAYIWNPHRGRK